MDRPAALSAIGNTPVVRLERLVEPGMAEVWVKLEAFAMARRAAREDGVWSGPSTGANISAAIEVARRLGPGARVATIQVDSGFKYLSGPLYA